jgi:hypothetical protein
VPRHQQAAAALSVPAQQRRDGEATRQLLGCVQLAGVAVRKVRQRLACVVCVCRGGGGGGEVRGGYGKGGPPTTPGGQSKRQEGGFRLLWSAPHHTCGGQLCQPVLHQRCQHARLRQQRLAPPCLRLDRKQHGQLPGVVCVVVGHVKVLRQAAHVLLRCTHGAQALARWTGGGCRLTGRHVCRARQKHARAVQTHTSTQQPAPGLTTSSMSTGWPSSRSTNADEGCPVSTCVLPAPTPSTTTSSCMCVCWSQWAVCDTDRQTDRQTGRQTDRQTDRQHRLNRRQWEWALSRTANRTRPTHTMGVTERLCVQRHQPCIMGIHIGEYFHLPHNIPPISHMPTSQITFCSGRRRR